MERKKLWKVSVLPTLSFSKKKKTQINVNPEVNISNTIEESKKQLAGTDINKNNSKYRKDNFEKNLYLIL